MRTIILWMLKGATYGGMGAGGLFIAGFAIEILNAGCAILTCDCDRSLVFHWSGMWNILFICVIGGAVIGLVYGFFKAKQESDADTARIAAEKSEEARKQRVRWANEIKQKALNVSNTCSRNLASDKPLISADYKADDQMKEILNELTRTAEKQGKIHSIAEELSEKDGVSV